MYVHRPHYCFLYVLCMSKSLFVYFVKIWQYRPRFISNSYKIGKYMFRIISLRPTHLKNYEPPGQYRPKENCGPGAKTARLPDGPIQEMDTQTSHPRKSDTSKLSPRECRHPGRRIQLLQPRLGTSMPRELRSHCRKFESLEHYSKLN